MAGKVVVNAGSPGGGANHRFVVLLRGINVGGKNKLPMADLRAALEANGFSDVSTYIQSGNIALRAASCRGADISNMIAERFGYDIPAVVLNAQQLRDIVAGNPEQELVEKNPKYLHVYFCQEPVSAEALEALDTLDHQRFLPDRLSAGEACIYAAYPNGMAKSKLTNAVLDRALGQVTTARNWNTVLKLVEMVDE